MVNAGLVIHREYFPPFGDRSRPNCLKCSLFLTNADSSTRVSFSSRIACAQLNITTKRQTYWTMTLPVSSTNKILKTLNNNDNRQTKNISTENNVYNLYVDDIVLYGPFGVYTMP